jgi:hypothetical protein
VKESKRELIDKLDKLTGSYLIYKYTPNIIITSLELPVLLSLDSRFDLKRKAEITVYEFVWFILRALPHPLEEDVYLAAGATQLFKEIIKRAGKSRAIVWTDFIQYIFETVLDSESLSNLSQTKLLEKTRSLKEVDEAPIVFGGRSVTIG